MDNKGYCQVYVGYVSLHRLKSASSPGSFLVIKRGKHVYKWIFIMLLLQGKIMPRFRQKSGRTEILSLLSLIAFEK